MTPAPTSAPGSPLPTGPALPMTLPTAPSTSPAAVGTQKGIPAAGVLLCLLSAVCFGLSAVIAKAGYAAGWDVPSLLTVRFAIASLLLWAIVAIRRPARPERRTIWICIALGAVGYALQAALYFQAITLLDAGLVAQLVYVYPALVFLMAIALRRERVRARSVLALACTTIGLVLLLGGGGGTGFSMTGVVLALACAVVYALYIIVSDVVPAATDPYLVTAIVSSSATVTLGGWMLASGRTAMATEPSGWLWPMLFAIVSTLLAISLFLRGLRIVGPSVAAVLSCIEPVVTAASAALLFGEIPAPVQYLGAATVLGAMVLLLTGKRREPAPPVAAAPIASQGVAPQPIPSQPDAAQAVGSQAPDLGQARPQEPVGVAARSSSIAARRRSASLRRR
ncbi:EamA family transporter [Nakamurella sp. YIM 132087]|uniref:EamA family transporter n=1 Tax=Nakamurella alba TaxID=2665158 RepID=A0A7K1FIX5_9ACTN|nr:EamA family transporter [Nakamurella alba]MTD14062.1 EamA family transporter [Nakamurella alba]